MNLTVRRARPDEADIAADIVKKVYAEMPEENKNYFCIDSIDQEAERIRSGEDLAWFAIDEDEDGKAAAVFIAEFPGSSDKSLGNDAGLSEEKLKLAAHMDTAAVLPAYRGRGLQRRLMETAESSLRKKGYRYLLCTVHPDNSFSRDNIVSMGYRKVKQCLKYGGKLRDVMLKEL